MTRDQRNVRVSVVWALLQLLNIAVCLALGAHFLIAMAGVVVASIAADTLARWLIDPPSPPPEDRTP